MSHARPKQQDPYLLPVLRPHAVGIDVGATQLYVALPPDRATAPVRVFGTFTADLQELAAWLLAHGITTVALESTGVYWIPLFQLLEAHGLEVCLVNARHVKNVRGRKTDYADCQWLQLLHSVGLLEASFRPPDAVCALRSLLRHRGELVAQASQHIQHMQKALTQMNLHLHHVLADLTGDTGLRIIDAILAGERDPEQLARLRDPRVKASRETVAKALTGDWRPEHLFVLRQSVAVYRYYQQQLRECDAEVERLLAASESQVPGEAAPPPPPNTPSKPRKNQLRFQEGDLRTELFRLYGTDVTQCPGLGAATVVQLYAELGTGLQAAFGTAKRFGRWARLCPDPRKTGGRVVRTHTPQMQHRVALLFRLAARTLARSQTALGQFYRRLRAKYGPAHANTATAYKLARIFFHLVTTKESYDESVFQRMELQHRERNIKQLRQRANDLGFTLVAAT